MADELAVKQESWVESTRAYLGDIRSEMKRVTWPSKEKVQSTTIVVTLSVFAFAAYLAIVDKLVNLSVMRVYDYLVK